ncbi:unnamed protein product [Lasius platythorax]|uniref:Uncharacterized protein n=2 Tax=Lasius TaxID=488720 RepID=A0A0J7K4W9_LASNI|nr:hypothetical protein RF55_16345 [Lasius niger]
MEIDVLWSYGGLMDIHWMPISMWGFWQVEAAASRQWEEQQLEKQRKHSEELVRLSNALNSAIDRLLTGINMRAPPVVSTPYLFHQHGFRKSWIFSLLTISNESSDVRFKYEFPSESKHYNRSYRF